MILNQRSGRDDRMTQEKKQAEPGQRFQKEDLIQADLLKPYQDAAVALLDQDQEYTLQEAGEIINQFLKGKVK